MTSQLNVDTIVDKAGSGGTNVKVANTSTYVSDGGAVTQNTVQGLAKAFCHWNSDSTIANGFNISSIDDDGTGDWDLNFTNAFSNSQSIITSMPDNTFTSSHMAMLTTTGVGTSDVTVYGVITTGSNVDVGAHVAIHGDLA